jgi:formylmethanofuran dehydrogenase subunit C
MSGWHLKLLQQPPVRLDLRGVTPASLAGFSTSHVEHHLVGCGNALAPLAEFFKVDPAGTHDHLVFEGDLSRCDRIGWQLAGGCIRVDGPVGHYAGGAMTAGDLHVHGSAGLLAGCEMSGGRLTVDGDVGDFAASTLPGSMDGMRGGLLTVKGNAGERFGDRMRRGTALVFGNAGDFLASRMVAGTIGLGGAAGAHLGYGMRRGSVVFAGANPAPRVAATFVPALVEPLVFWQLLARDLARHGGPFASLPSRRIERHLGDLATDGRGELIVAR